MFAETFLEGGSQTSNLLRPWSSTLKVPREETFAKAQGLTAGALLAVQIPDLQHA